MAIVSHFAGGDIDIMVRFGERSDIPDKKGIADRMKSKWRTIAVLIVILATAAFIRIYFAAGIMGASFALSGGSDATYHLRVIREFVETGNFIIWDDYLNYPLTSVNPNPPLFDLMVGTVAYLATVFGMSPSTAASAALACQAPVFGVLSCIAAYYLGREITGSSAGGILTSLFMAMCPILIATSVISMGTETAFVSFLAVMMFYFTVRFIRATDSETDFGGLKGTLKGNRSALINALLAGVFMALIVLSWNGFHILILAYSVLMAIQLFYDRFTRRDPRPLTLFYSITIMLGLLIAVPVFLGVSLFRPLLLGTLLYAIMACVACTAFAETRRMPWIATIPVFAGITVLALALLYYFGGGLFNDVIFGGSLYGSSQFAELMRGNTTSVSALSAYFGWVTMWLGWASVFVMILLRKSMASRHYLFTMSWLVVLMVISWRNVTLASIAAPAYAVGFAIISIQIYKTAGLKDYLSSLKASDATPFLKKMLKPIPLLSIISVILLVGAPNAMYAMDAGISYNEKDERNESMGPLFSGDVFGAIGYNVMTPDNWVIGDAFGTQAGVTKEGAMFTWAEYVSDAVTRGGYKSVSDPQGNGSAAASNMLLASASDGGVIAAMLIRLLSVNGPGALETALKGAGMSDADYNELKAVMADPDSKRSEVLLNPGKYGIISSDVSCENLMYIYLGNMLTERYGQSQVANMYDDVCAATGDKISYGAVGGTMFPLYPQYSNAFLMLAFLNGYVVDSGSVPQFATSSYYGFVYTSEMYDTYLWRSYIGMSPEEAGYTGTFGAYNYFNDLSLSDGTVVPHPGFGMSGFEVEYWEVMYNPDEDATHSSDGWVRMSQPAAVELQKSNGGLINYMSGLPLIMRYVGVTGTDVSGTVTMGADNISGIRVSAVDSDGMVRSTAFTDTDGNYSVTVPTGGKINFYSGSVNLTDGVLIQSSDPAAIINCAIPPTSLSGSLSGATVPTGATLKLTGTASGGVYTSAFTGNTFSISGMMPDEYAVEVLASDGTSLKTTTVTVHPGASTGFVIDLDDAEVEITVKNMYGEALVGKTVTLTNVDTGETYSAIAGATETVAKTSVPAGWYTATAADATFGTAFGSMFQASSTATATKATITCAPTTDIPVVNRPAEPYVVHGPTFRSVNGTFVPDGADSGAVPAYSFYKVEGDQVTWNLTTLALSTVTGYEVSGVLKNSAGKAVSGTLAIIADDGRTLYLSVGSDGAYSAMLPTGTYTLYAYTTSEASVSEITVATSAVPDWDITMGSAYKISGNVRWGTFALPYLKMLVTIGDSDTVIPMATDKSGAYSLMVPDSWKASVKIEFSPGSEFEFKDASATPVTYEKFTEENVSSGNTADRNFNFTVYATVKVKNNTPYEMKVGSTTIAASGTNTFNNLSSNTMTVETINASGNYFRQVGMPVYDGMVLDVDSNVFPEPYYKLTITSAADADVKVTASSDGGKVTYLSGNGTVTRTYMVLGGHDYTIIATSADGKQMAVGNVSVTTDVASDVSAMDRIVTFTGYVGASASGTLEVTTASGAKIQGTVSGGTYTIKVPVSGSGSMTFSVDVTMESDGTEYPYSATRTVKSTDILAEWDSAVVNLAVLNDGAGVPEVTGVTMSTILTAMDMTDLRNSEVEFTVTITMTSDRTVVLTGSGWRSLTFYSDPGRNTPASAISTTGVLYATGVFDGRQMAAQDLKVSAADLSGKSMATATLSDAVPWEKTTDGEVTFSRGTDVVSENEYMYAISVNNTYNYTKTYTISPISEAGWHVTLVSADGLTLKDLSSSAQTFDVKGLSEETVYVKLTTKSLQKTAPGVVPDVNITVDDGTPVFQETFEHETAELSLDKTSADGRGALIELSDIPAVFWGLLVTAVLLLLLTLWLGYRRGVFSRRK